MSLKEGCATCCAVYSLIGIVLLMFFGMMFQRGGMTFHIIAAKHDWDMQEKAKACFMGAVWYGVTLVISVFAKVFLSKSNASA